MEPNRLTAIFNSMKICPRCSEPNKSFYKMSRSRDGLSYICKDCTNKEKYERSAAKLSGTYVKKPSGKKALTEEEKQRRRTELAVYSKEYRKTNAEKLSILKRTYNDNLKVEGILRYGSICTCCGESNPLFLTIEHINGRNKSIKKRTGKREWARLKSLGWPKEDITLLCFNCNCAKGAYGSCPHTWNKNESTN